MPLPSLAADEAERAGAPGASGRRPKEAMRAQPGCLRRAARRREPRRGAGPDEQMCTQEEGAAAKAEWVRCEG